MTCPKCPILLLLLILCCTIGASLANNRPPLASRTFTSESVNNVIDKVSASIASDQLKLLFQDCLPNTLDTTVQSFSESAGVDDAFVVTGDISAMWLRDSSRQIEPYFEILKASKPFDSHLYALLSGVKNRLIAYILHDAYANAFNFRANNAGHQSDQRAPRMTALVFEGKYELDSLCSVLRVTNRLYNVTARRELLDADWQAAVVRIVDVMRYQQAATADESDADRNYYSFARTTSVPTDTLLHKVGPPAARCGLIKSAFRPSDDATRLPYLVPANAFAVVELRAAADLFERVLANRTMADTLRSLADEVDSAIARHAIVTDASGGGNVLAYEVDCFGSHTLMDDANVPSLLSLPYLGYMDASDPLYTATRRRILSDANPYYAHGSAASGIGSAHGHGQRWIWPMSIIMQALTSTDESEVRTCLKYLITSSAGTGFMHESFDKDDAHAYTRSWFAWANTSFGELILRIAKRFPNLLNEPF
jgi:uncharacterized protein